MPEEYNHELEEKEKKLSENDDYSESPPSDIVAFNELRSCSDLVRMYKADQLIIQPDFQRDVVWNNPAQTRFIDSLVKQLPIPSMCISLDYKTEQRLMIDGLQRISSVIKFLTEDDWRLSTLEDIDPKISGKTSSYIKQAHREIHTRVENLTIPITVLRCDYSKKSHMNYLFTIFHRLNTGGNKLSNQEIRNCIFSGSLNDFLKETVQQTITRELLSLEDNNSYRFAYEELFLRIFTFSERLNQYKGKLAKFLNEYMEDNKNMSNEEISHKKHKIERVIKLLYIKIFKGNPMPKLSKATTESIFIGIMNNIDELEQESENNLIERIGQLRSNQLFSAENLKEGLSAPEKVKARINKAIEIFG